MKGTREIKNRIRAVDSASKITLAMQLVAASKMKKAQDFAINSRSYLLRLSEVVARLPEQKIKKNIHPFFITRSDKKRCIVVISTDRGLCGVLNNNLFRQIPKGDNISFISIGRKAMQFLSREKCNLLASFSVTDKVQYHEILSICEFIAKLFIDGEIDTLEVLFQKFANTLKYIPCMQKILPMNGFFEEFEKMLMAANVKREYFEQDSRELIFEPKINEIIDHIARIFLKYNLHQVLLESKASEHSSRMVAMKSATDNAKSLSQELKLEYNKVRQYAITNEIIELSASSSENI